MKRALSALLLLIHPFSLFAKGDTVRITIKGESLTQPIEISDAAVIRRFDIWTGPGTTNRLDEGLNVDWARPVADLPKGCQLFEVAFEVAFTTGPRLRRYVVIYALDPSSHHGYVYIPGRDDPPYRDNVALILRGTEGKWFRALGVWEKIANPRIAGSQSAHN